MMRRWQSNKVASFSVGWSPFLGHSLGLKDTTLSQGPIGVPPMLHVQPKGGGTVEDMLADEG